jgi:hypothetical protein
MEWYWVLAIIAYGVCFMYGLGWGVVNTDELMGLSTDPLQAFVTWFMCGVVGPGIVLCALVKSFYENCRLRRQQRLDRQNGIGLS